MGRARVFWAVGLALVAAAGAEARVEERSSSLGESFSLSAGESMTIEAAGFSLAFEDVLRDSRCPPDVQCVRAGEAVVVLVLRDGEDRTTRLELEVPPGGGAEAAHESYTVRVVSLEPPAQAGKRLERKDYRVELVVEAAPEV